MHHARFKLCRRRRFRRSLVAGALLTLLTTWAPAFFAHYTHGDVHSADEDLRLDPAVLSTCPIAVPGGWTIRTWNWSAGPGVRRDTLSECIWLGSTLGAMEWTAPNRTRTVISSGWPLRTAEYIEFDRDMPPDLTRAPASWFRFGVPIVHWRRLPLHFYPLALVINLAFWTGLAYAIAAGFRAIRSRHRHRQGLCTACAYPLSGVSVCPECGEPTQITRGSPN